MTGTESKITPSIPQREVFWCPKCTLFYSFAAQARVIKNPKIKFNLEYKSYNLVL
jgi:hypothetical protein